MVDKTLSLLGIAKKAGLLAIGSESAAISARHGKAKLIISACDASAGSIRRAKANAEAAGLQYLAVPYSKFELGNITGRGSPGVIAFLDKGLADGFVKKIAAQPMPPPEPMKPAETAKLTASAEQTKQPQNPANRASRKESDVQ